MHGIPRNTLAFDEIQQPTRSNGPASEQGEAVRAKAHHHLRLRALRNPEDDRGEEGEQQNGSEVGHGYEAFLPLASECASTAAITLSRPATTMNVVP